jgi:multidrug efflux pump subunit AcrA (membrane-fusion protein)
VPDRPNTEPLRTASGAIILDEVQRKLDAARAAYRASYNRGYSLSERGESERAQRYLDNANAMLRRAEAEYEAARRAVPARMLHPW